MSNGYVIWKNGLDGEKPNPYAVKQGNTYIDRMFYTRSMDVRSSFYEFVDFLYRIQRKEAEKEKRFLTLKLEQMRKNAIDLQRVEAINRAFQDNNFGLAYTLMLELDTSIEELKRELKSPHFNNISHMNSFWGKQFSSYFEKILQGQVEIRGHQLVSTINANPNLTISSIVDGWITEMIGGSQGVAMQSLEPLREQMKKELLQYFQKAGIQGVNSYTNSIFGSTGNLTQLRKLKTTQKKNGKDKELSNVIREAANCIGNAVGKGVAQELVVTSQQGRNGISFNTGTVQKQIRNEFTGQGYKVAQKGDITSFELFNAEIDFEGLAKSVFSQSMLSTEEQIKLLREKLEYLSTQKATDVFEISTNVKGYRSKKDLQIEGEGSFAQRTSNLVKMAQEAEGIPQYSMEKLIFMLNNTVDGCIMENRVDRLTNYIAAVCVAWMWDDYTDLFSVSESNTGIQKIRMFNSGGFYYSASQIIGQTLEELLKRQKGSSFVVVDIIPPSFDADGMYASLKNKYPVPFSGNKEAWDSALRPRWDEMRNYVRDNGKISIKFNQQGLEELLGKLEQYL